MDLRMYSHACVKVYIALLSICHMNTSTDILLKLIKIVEDNHRNLLKFVEAHNKYTDYIVKRFDDVDKRLCVLELKMDQSSKDTQENFRAMRKDTGILPDIFNLLTDDGKDIAHLRERIIKLEN